MVRLVIDVSFNLNCIHRQSAHLIRHQSEVNLGKRVLRSVSRSGKRKSCSVVQRVFETQHKAFGRFLVVRSQPDVASGDNVLSL